MKGFYPNSYGQCVACKAGCSDCASYEVCFGCSSGYLSMSSSPVYNNTGSTMLSSSTATCLPCAEPCASCIGDAHTCLSCTGGYQHVAMHCVTNYHYEVILVLTVEP